MSWPRPGSPASPPISLGRPGLAAAPPLPSPPSPPAGTRAGRLRRVTYCSHHRDRSFTPSAPVCIRRLPASHPRCGSGATCICCWRRGARSAFPFKTVLRPRIVLSLLQPPPLPQKDPKTKTKAS